MAIGGFPYMFKRFFRTPSIFWIIWAASFLLLADSGLDAERAGPLLASAGEADRREDEIQDRREGAACDDPPVHA